MSKEITRLKNSMRKPRQKDAPITDDDLLSTGAALLNRACSGRIKGGFAKGKYVLLVGDSESGKTWFSMSCLAEATKDPAFKNYRLIHIDPEDGASMDKARYFGKELPRRLEVLNPPVTLEEFYDQIDTLQEEGKPFIAVLDSENSLSCKAELTKIKKQKLARLANREEAGSMAMDKAKIHSTRLRVVRNRLRKTKSILIIISQTRDRVGFAAKFDPKTRAGGNALKFFADLEMWTSVSKRIKTKKIRGKEREIGMTTKVKIKKNRLTGKKPTVLIDFYHDVGIDDTGSCVKYLLEEQHWKEVKGIITAKEFDMRLPFERLVKWIEATDNEPSLHKIVRTVWSDIESEMSITRKKRY